MFPSFLNIYRSNHQAIPKTKTCFTTSSCQQEIASLLLDHGAEVEVRLCWETCKTLEANASWLPDITLESWLFIARQGNRLHCERHGLLYLMNFQILQYVHVYCAYMRTRSSWRPKQGRSKKPPSHAPRTQKKLRPMLSLLRALGIILVHVPFPRSSMCHGATQISCFYAGPWQSMAQAGGDLDWKWENLRFNRMEAMHRTTLRITSAYHRLTSCPPVQAEVWSQLRASCRMFKHPFCAHGLAGSSTICLQDWWTIQIRKRKRKELNLTWQCAAMAFSSRVKALHVHFWLRVEEQHSNS